MKAREILILLALVSLITCVFSALLLVLARRAGPPAITEETMPSIPTPTKEILSIDTPKGMLIKGDVAYVDGRDLDATPPLTVMSVNVWDAVPRTRPLCQLPHGAEVDILDIRYYAPEGRHYLMVLGGDCQGWVSEPFLSDKRHAPVGDQL